MDFGLESGCWRLRVRCFGLRVLDGRWTAHIDSWELARFKMYCLKFEVGHVVAVLEIDQPPELWGQIRCRPRVLLKLSVSSLSTPPSRALIAQRQQIEAGTQHHNNRAR